MFSFPRDRSRGEEPTFGSAVVARGYALHHLKNACVVWGVLALLSLMAIVGFYFADMWKTYAPVSAILATSLLLISLFMGARALADLFGSPISFEAQVAGKHASLFWYKAFFQEDRYYLRLERGGDHRPLSYGTGIHLSEGWFLSGKGYYDILMAGDRVRGTVYRRTRLIDSLVKV